MTWTANKNLSKIGQDLCVFTLWSFYGISKNDKSEMLVCGFDYYQADPS